MLTFVKKIIVMHVWQMIKETFGNTLHLTESEAMSEFPSPEDLKGKIIVSTKPPKEYLQTKSSKEDSQKGGVEEEESVWGDEIPDNKALMAVNREVLRPVFYYLA
jgi:phosphatidylinositol phospholipase C delta